MFMWMYRTKSGLNGLQSTVGMVTVPPLDVGSSLLYTDTTGRAVAMAHDETTNYQRNKLLLNQQSYQLT